MLAKNCFHQLIKNRHLGRNDKHVGGGCNIVGFAVALWYTHCQRGAGLKAFSHAAMCLLRCALANLQCSTLLLCRERDQHIRFPALSYLCCRKAIPTLYLLGNATRQIDALRTFSSFHAKRRTQHKCDVLRLHLHLPLSPVCFA